jgi:G3E family GTPase
MFQVELGQDSVDDAERGADRMEIAGVIKALNGAVSLEQVARLDACVTVVDCAAFSGNLTTTADLLEQFGARQQGGEDDGGDEAGSRSVAQLLIEQIEFANIVVLNKCDLVSPEAALAVEASVRVLNPGAEVGLVQVECSLTHSLKAPGHKH